MTAATSRSARSRRGRRPVAVLGWALVAALPLLVVAGPARTTSAPASAEVAAPGSPVSSASAARAAAPTLLRLVATSTRPDLVSGGDAKVAVLPARGLRWGRVEVRVDGRDVTRRFAVRPNGRFEGYLTGLRVGRSVVQASAPGYRGRLVLTNHPQGGPLFTGPQTRHYRCQASARDAQCNQPPSYRYLYRSTNPLAAGLQPYDPADPPSDVATTTTDQGVEVPFVVRRENGFADRDRYTILTLWQPEKAWTRYAPQRQFNGKVLVTHGGGCGVSYAPGEPPLADYSGTIPEEVPLLTPSYVTALGRGFAVLSSALDNTGHHCGVATNAESVMMLKERFVEQYGDIRYTIGTGCSGGSIAQHTVANAYPGIYQGLVTTCSYPDVFTAGAQFADYHLLRLYFEDPTRWGPGVAWLPTQMAAVEGHLSHLNAVVADEGLFKSALNPEDDCPGTVDAVPGRAATRYDRETNPGGVRCSVLDLLVNQLGRRPRAVWTAPERAVGRGFGGLPFANAGVLYGLEQLRSGTITPAQFVDLNVKIGGLDVDSRHTEERIVGDPASIANAYRTGLVNEADHLGGVAMINFGGPDPGLAHDYAHAFWTEDRLQRAQGHTDNRVMWFGATPLLGDPRWATEAFLAMDRWLTRVERDRSDRALARKIVVNKPDDVTDRCANLPGVLEVPGADDEVDCVLPESLQLRLSTPREQAGGDRLNDVLACRREPLTDALVDELVGGSPLPLSADQLAALREVYPDGVCDWSRPGRGQGPALTWLGYGDADGTPVYGGRELPDVRGPQAAGWFSTSFAPLLRQ